MSGSEFSFDIDLEISLTELEYIEAKYASENASGEISENTQFVYAWALIRSRFWDDIKLGVEKLENIMSKYPTRKRECLFYLASAYYKIGEYKKAIYYIDQLSLSEPNNQQVLAMKHKIEKKLTNDGILGLAVVGGLAAATLGILISFYRTKRR